MSMVNKKDWEQLAEFHFSPQSDIPVKAQLYLTGISALAVQFMQETSADSFECKATLPHKSSGKEYRAVFRIEEVKS